MDKLVDSFGSCEIILVNFVIYLLFTYLVVFTFRRHVSVRR